MNQDLILHDNARPRGGMFSLVSILHPPTATFLAPWRTHTEDAAALCKFLGMCNTGIDERTSMERRWNDDGRVRLKHSERNLSQYHFVYHKSHWTDLGSKLGLRGEKPSTSRPKYGAAVFVMLKQNSYRNSGLLPCICWLSERCRCWKASDCLMLVIDVHFRIERWS
jgi:hypothetical protein